jgi:hypothetical protein
MPIPDHIFSTIFHGPRIGWAIWRRDWMSSCSRHSVVDPTCPRCQRGRYHWAVAAQVSAVVYRWAPGGWRWVVNRRRTGTTQEKALANFPGASNTLLAEIGYDSRNQVLRLLGVGEDPAWEVLDPARRQAELSGVAAVRRRVVNWQLTAEEE